MSPKETRKLILERLYAYRTNDFGIWIDDLVKTLPEVDEKSLHGELSYLEQKGWVKLGTKFSGKEYLNFSNVSITAWGVDLVEDPNEFGKLFSISVDARQNHFNNISGSNITIDSQYVSQIIEKQDKETKELLSSLLKATHKKDKSEILRLLKLIGDKSLDLFIAIIAGGIKL